MVRKGSPVRVRQRALEKPPHMAAFCLGCWWLGGAKRSRGPYLGRIRTKPPSWKGSARRGACGSASVRRGRPDDVERAVRHGDEVIEQLALGKTVGVRGGVGDDLDERCL